MAAMKPYEERKARERQADALKKGDTPVDASRHQRDEAGRTAEKLAEKAGVGTRTVNRAITVREKGIPELNDKVASGEITVNEAEQIAMLKPEQQRKLTLTDWKRIDSLEMAGVL